MWNDFDPEMTLLGLKMTLILIKYHWLITAKELL